MREFFEVIAEYPQEASFIVAFIIVIIINIINEDKQ